MSRWERRRVDRGRGRSFTEWRRGPHLIVEERGNVDARGVERAPVFELHRGERWQSDHPSLADAKHAAGGPT